MSTIFSKEYANLYLYENYNRKILKSIDFSFAYFNENNILIKKHCDFGCGTGDICSYIKK